MTKDQAYNQATLTELGNNPTGTRMLVVYRAMDEYSKRQCVDFAEWIAENVNSHYADGRRFWIMKFGPRNVVTTEELYNLFLQSTEK